MECKWENVRTQAFEWYHFKWPWVTLKIHFKVSTTDTVEGLLSGRVCAIAVKLRVVKNCFVLFRLTPNEASCWRRRTRGWKTTQMSEFETARRSRGCRTTSSSSATASRWCSQSSWQKENIRTTLAVSGTTYLLLLCRNRPVHLCITFYQPPGASGYCFARHHAVAVCLWVCLSVLKSFLTVTPLQMARFASTVHIKPYQQDHQRMVMSYEKVMSDSELSQSRSYVTTRGISRHDFSPWLLQFRARRPSCVYTGASAVCNVYKMRLLNLIITPAL